MFITLFFLTPAFIFNILLLVAIITERTLPRSIRFILSNITIASEVVIVGITVILVQNVILSGCMHLSSSLFVCRFSYVTLTSGAAARLMYMATFAIAVYVLVRHGPAKLHFHLLFPSGLILWFLAIILNTALFSTDVLEITFHNGSDCAPHGKNVTTPLYTFTYIVVYGLSSFILGVTFPILSISHIRRNKHFRRQKGAQKNDQICHLTASWKQYEFHRNIYSNSFCYFCTKWWGILHIGEGV